MRQRLSACFLVRGIKNQAVLQFPRNYHLGDRVREPFLDLFHHVVHIGVNKAVQFIRPEAKPRHRLQKAVSAPVRTSPSHHQLPEPEALNLRILARPTKLPDEVRAPCAQFHWVLHFRRMSSAIPCATGLCDAKKRKYKCPPTLFFIKIGSGTKEKPATCFKRS